MGEKRIPITDLSAKLDYLIHSALVGGVTGINDLSQKLRIEPATFRGYRHLGKISLSANDLVAEFFGFDPKSLAWLKGSAADFQKHYEMEAKSPTHPMSRASRTGIQLTPIFGRPQQSSQHLAALELFVQQGDSQRPWPIRMQLMGSAAPMEGTWIAIKCGYVEVDCGMARANPRDWLGYGKGRTKVGNGNIEIEVVAGTSFKPSWLVHSGGAVLGQLLLEDSLCVLRDVGANDVVEATFNVYAKDVKGTQFVAQADGGPLKRNKKAVLSAIAANCILGRKDGLATLCRHTISFRQTSELEPTPPDRVVDE